MSLSRDMVTSRLCLTQPVSVCVERNEMDLTELTRLELRDRLTLDGWQLATVDARADVVSRHMLPHRPAAYFRCLLHPCIVHIPGSHQSDKSSNFS